MDERGTGSGPGWFDAGDTPLRPTPAPWFLAADQPDAPPADPQPAEPPRLGIRSPPPARPATHAALPQPTVRARNPAVPASDVDASTRPGADHSLNAVHSGTAIPDTTSAATEVIASPRVSRGRRAATIAGRTFLALLSAVALAATGVGWVSLGQANKQVTKTDVLASVPNTPQVDDGATDILLVGSDSRTDAEGRPLPTQVLKELRTEATTGVNTDTIILIRIPHNGGRAYGLSIPRDTYVPIPGYREDKINAAYGVLADQKTNELRRQGNLDPATIAQESDQAGRRALIGTVQDLTGLKVDHYAEVNLYGFYLLTEAVGGVQVCLKRATADEDSGANFQAGTQNISGGDALSFVRQRKNLPRGDLDRIVRQQVFMAALVKKILSTGTLTNPGVMSGLLASARKSVVLDQDWDISAFAQQMQGLSGGAVAFQTIPVTSIDGRSDRGQSIVTVDKNQVHAFVAGLVASPTPSPPTRPVPPAPPGNPGPTSGGQHLGDTGIVGLDGARTRPQPSPSGSAAPETPDSRPGSGDGSGDQQQPISPDGIPCVN